MDSADTRPRTPGSLARAGANFYRHPGKALRLVGITGTNGKTTTAFLIDSILHAASGWTTGLRGNQTGYRTPKGSRTGANTHARVAGLAGDVRRSARCAGGTHAVLQTRFRHALAMDRLWSCHFAVAIFTNLTRDATSILRGARPSRVTRGASGICLRGRARVMRPGRSGASTPDDPVRRRAWKAWRGGR